MCHDPYFACPRPTTPEGISRDRAVGALVGLAIGDAVGTTLEFSARDDMRPRLDDMVGGGPFRLKPGQWTDDTAMALALADSLIACDQLDEADLLQRFCEWWHTGKYSCTGTCFDIGSTIAAALKRWETTGNIHAGSNDPRTAGNGSLMRLAPVAIRFHNDRARLIDAAERQSLTTHGAREAVEACCAYAELLADFISGPYQAQVLAPREGYGARVGEIMLGGWRDKERDQIRGSGYVLHSLEAALWCVANSGNFGSAVLLAANLCEDADTTAAITGQLAGAIHGLSGIRSDWVQRLAWSEKIQRMGHLLFERSLT
jgi:ADP-ribosyl-[dinitrogen reductase] hydrolase